MNINMKQISEPALGKSTQTRVSRFFPFYNYVSIEVLLNASQDVSADFYFERNTAFELSLHTADNTLQAIPV